MCFNKRNNPQFSSLPAHALWSMYCAMQILCAFDVTVSCSYVYTDGKLASVPASRAAVFRDRTLGPMDKRLLTRFLMQLGSSPQDYPFPQVHTIASEC